MGKKKAGNRRPLAKAVSAILKGVRRAKDIAKGKSWTRLHRIESELSTVAGTKTALKKKVTTGKKR